MVLVRSENGQLLMIPQQALAQMQAQAHAQSQPQNTMTPRPATPTSAPPVQISTVQVSSVICRVKLVREEYTKKQGMILVIWRNHS